MLKKIDRKVAAAMTSLEGSHDFQIFLGYLNESLTELRKNNQSTKDDVLCRWEQGAIQALDQLVDSCLQARNILHRFK